MEMPFSDAAQRGLARFDQMEQHLCLAMNRASAWAPMRSFFAAVSRVGDGAAWYALMIVLAATQGSYGAKSALAMGIPSLIGVGLYKVLKKHLVRERPYLTHREIRVGCAPLDRYSFPSGHTLHAVLFATIATAWFPALVAVLIPLAVLIGVSRVVLGLHYPTDVVVGALMGWCLAQAALWLVPPVA